ncbi:unnamed protein product [Linum tenue]|uniref:Sphingomyelin phosphodiesterase 4 n=1 Tax=Linum tenue TaxID=586396 RepID=A0AAV0JT81_9ROSI|nr:unnamed protein product [Linum tenue]
MNPYSFTVDSLSKSQDLAAAILASSTPSQISAACSSLDAFLRSHSPDQSRHFFSLAFPALICKLYGFDDASPSPPPPPPSSSSGGGGWIDVVFHSNDADLAARVFDLLSPDGVLFHLISAVDRQSLVKYVFPTERLPEWARLVLSADKDCQGLNALCPVFQGKVREGGSSKGSSSSSSSYQIQLNVFEYFVYWFAYYPICKANSENSSGAMMSATKSKTVSKLENWASSIPRLSHAKRGNEQKLECNLYVRLLYAYLRAFVPVQGMDTHQPYRSSLLHYGYGGDGGSSMMRAEFFVDTLVHYWLVDNDFSPLPVNLCKSVGLSFSLRSVLGETPPSSSLGEVVKLLVKYLNCSARVAQEVVGRVENANGGRFSPSSFDMKSGELVASVYKSSELVGSWNLCIQRPLYRFILRTFLFCPMGTSLKNASQVFSVWVMYMEPWKIAMDDFLELDTNVGSSGIDMNKKVGQSRQCGYQSSWEGYVLSNYLYYSSLIMHFIGFAHKFLHTDPVVIAEMVLKVITVLTSNKELINLIKNVDKVFHTKQAGSGKAMLSSLYKYVPLIRDQLQDWEDGLCESDADGSYLHENWNRDLRLFSDAEDGGQQLLQLFLLRAESELQANSGVNFSQNLELIESLKEQVSCLFGCYAMRSISFTPEKKQLAEHTRDDIFTPRKLGNHTFADVKYKGDWMKRPVSADEVAWLANWFVCLSCWLNETLGLDRAENGDVSSKWSYVEVSSYSANIDGPTETMKTMLHAICSWLLILGATVIGLMRKHGIRVNLRPLALKKVITVLLLSALFSVVKKGVRMFLRA